MQSNIATKVTLRAVYLDRISAKQYAKATVKVYWHWIAAFARFHHPQPPRELGAAEVEAFLSHLAVVGQVSPSTQNQALAAILFLYREVLAVDLPWLDGITRAKPRHYLPTVLSVDETQRLLAHITGTPGLICRLLYGTGMRVMECLRLRIGDVDLQRNVITVRQAKGGKDRTTCLPESVKHALRVQIEHRRYLYKLDLDRGMVDVELPHAIARKYPAAHRDWPWQWLFVTRGYLHIPDSDRCRRHHLDARQIQRAMRDAARLAGIP
jgi:integron integrase